MFAPQGPPGSIVGTYKNVQRNVEILAMENPPPIFNSSCFFVRKTAFDAGTQSAAETRN